MLRDNVQLCKDKLKDKDFLKLDVGDEVTCSWDFNNRFKPRLVTEIRKDPFCSSGLRVCVNSYNTDNIYDYDPFLSGMDSSWCTPIAKLFPEEYYEAKLKGH